MSAATLLYWLSYYMLSAYVPIRMAALGLSDSGVAVAVTAKGFLPLLVALRAGRLADRHGGRRVVLPSVALMIALGPAHILASSTVEFVVVHGLLAVTSLGIWIPLQAAISHAGDGEQLRRRLAAFSLAWGIGMAVGPAVGAFVYDLHGFAVLCWLFTGLAVLLMLASLISPWPRGTPSPAQKSSLIGAARRLAGRQPIRAMLAASFMANYVNSIRNSFYPVILERRGVEVSDIGFLMLIMGFTMILVRIVLPLVLRRTSVNRALLVTTGAGALAIVMTPWLPGMSALAAAAILIGVCLGLTPPITVELVARYTATHERALSASLRVVANRFAQTAQPVVFGVTASLATIAAAFPISGVLLGGLGFAFMRGAPPPVGERL